MIKRSSLLQILLDYLLVIGIINSSNLFVYRLPYFQFIKLLSLVLILVAYIPRFSRNAFSIFLVFGIVAARAQIGFAEDSTLSFLHALVSTFLMASVVLIPVETKLRLFHIIKSFLFVVVSIGLVFHLLRLLGLFSERSLYVYTSLEGGRQWLVFPTQVYPIIRGQVEYSRFSSMFNEPGTLGFFVVFVLALSGYTFKQRKNIIMFVSGLFTVSLYFYIVSLMYIVLQYISRSSIKENTMRIVSVILVLIIAISLFPVLQDYLGSRFELAEEGGGLQDRRANVSYLKEYWDLLGELPTNQLLMGGAYEASLELELTHISWVHFVYRMGVIVSLLWFLYCMYYALKLRGNWLFVLVFFMLINNKPQVATPFHFFMLSLALGGGNIAEYSDTPVNTAIVVPQNDLTAMSSAK